MENQENRFEIETGDEGTKKNMCGQVKKNEKNMYKANLQNLMN